MLRLSTSDTARDRINLLDGPWWRREATLRRGHGVIFKERNIRASQ